MDEIGYTPARDILTMATDIVAAYVSRNHLQPSDLPALIAGVHTALAGLDSPAAAKEAGPEKPTSAQIRKSVTPDALVSFEDGKSYKTLKRHLGLHGLTPEAYRTKWGLPADYPMTAAGYSAQRSALAHSFGLGQQRRKAAAPEPAATPEPANDAVSDAPKRVGRPRKVKEPA